MSLNAVDLHSDYSTLDISGPSSDLSISMIAWIAKHGSEFDVVCVCDSSLRNAVCNFIVMAVCTYPSFDINVYFINLRLLSTKCVASHSLEVFRTLASRHQRISLFTLAHLLASPHFYSLTLICILTLCILIVHRQHILIETRYIIIVCMLCMAVFLVSQDGIRYRESPP